MRNCNGDAELPQTNLDNVEKHYTNIHTDCDPVSRSRKDSNNRYSRILFTDSVAIKRLTDTEYLLKKFGRGVTGDAVLSMQRTIKTPTCLRKYAAGLLNYCLHTQLTFI